jgi:hypothetical protein
MADNDGRLFSETRGISYEAGDGFTMCIVQPERGPDDFYSAHYQLKYENTNRQSRNIIVNRILMKKPLRFNSLFSILQKIASQEMVVVDGG